MSDDDCDWDYDVDIDEIDPVEFCFWCPLCLQPAGLCWCGTAKEPEDE